MIRIGLLLVLWMVVAWACAPLLAAEPQSAPQAAESTPAEDSQVAPDSDKSPGDDAEQASPGDDLPSIEALTERVRKSVVVITTAGRDGVREGMGAGFIISPDGHVVTNYHVIGEGRDIRVQLSSGRQVEVTQVHASDRELDLAVLKIDATDLEPLDLGDSDKIKQGQSVIALGNPRGLKYSVVSGVVSGVRDMEGRRMIQLAIPIEPGNSGGPLVDRQGRVQGVMTMKSLVTPNLGFALTINLLKPLLEKPNPIAMSRWQTIGALDARDWKPLFGANWRQRAGRIVVDGLGDGFGGRSLCLATADVPERPFEMTVDVKLDDESGAAGLAFCSDGGQRHYGFYPTNGQMRLTRFQGPDIQTWQILYSRPSRDYVRGEWNNLRVRLEEGKILCFVNDQPVVEISDDVLKPGKVGLVKFRDTEAEFKAFQVAAEVPRATVPADEVKRIVEMVDDLPLDQPADESLIAGLAADPVRAAKVLRQRASELDARAEQLRLLALEAHERRVVDDLLATLAAEEEKIDLFRAGLLIARLDNEEVDVEAYCRELDQMAADLQQSLADDADDAAKLAALKKYLFDENGFHGSRGDYYNRANSYLNEVLDDREGLPITLSVVYMELARRIGLNIVGVGLPGHFVVAHIPAEGERQLIDVFDGAETVSRAEAERRINAATDGELSPAQVEAVFEPATKRSIVFRMLQNLLSVSRSDPRAIHRYLNAMLAVDTEHGPYHLLRAMVRYQLNERERARDDVDWLLENEPPGVNLDQVRALAHELDRE